MKMTLSIITGTGVIIISPTRELSMQTFGVLREVMQEHTQTYGLIMGGADRKSEAVKLAKGKEEQLPCPKSGAEVNMLLDFALTCIAMNLIYQQQKGYTCINSERKNILAQVKSMSHLSQSPAQTPHIEPVSQERDREALH